MPVINVFNRKVTESRPGPAQTRLEFLMLFIFSFKPAGPAELLPLALCQVAGFRPHNHYIFLSETWYKHSLSILDMNIVINVLFAFWCNFYVSYHRLSCNKKRCRPRKAFWSGGKRVHNSQANLTIAFLLIST